MSSLLEYQNESPEGSLAGFRRFHQAFQTIISERSHSNRQALMCEYLRELLRVRSMGLYLLDSKTGCFRFHRGSAEIDEIYSGGYLEISREAQELIEEGIPLKTLRKEGEP